MTTDKFPFSGHPRNLASYDCYDDSVSEDWFNGAEYEGHTDWDGRAKAKWRFFYRPVPAAVGRPQKKQIKPLREELATTKAELSRQEWQLAWHVVYSRLVGAVTVWVGYYLFLLPLAYIVFRTVSYASRTNS